MISQITTHTHTHTPTTRLDSRCVSVGVKVVCPLQGVIQIALVDTVSGLQAVSYMFNTLRTLM